MNERTEIEAFAYANNQYARYFFMGILVLIDRLPFICPGYPTLNSAHRVVAVDRDVE
jgi:hypothetical protein